MNIKKTNRISNVVLVCMLIAQQFFLSNMRKEILDAQSKILELENKIQTL
jgi:hypothetical protein